MCEKRRPTSRRRPCAPLPVHPGGAGHVPRRRPVRGRCVARSAYYAWARRGVSARAQADEYWPRRSPPSARSRRTYGARASTPSCAAGCACARKARGAADARRGLVGCHRRRRIRTTVADSADRPPRTWSRGSSPPPVPNCLCGSAVSRTWRRRRAGSTSRFCSTHSRRVVGWAMADHLRTALAAGALTMALQRRRPTAGLVHHTDRGCQYTADAYQRVLAGAPRHLLDEPGRRVPG